jgi:hypothetical protein
MEPNIIFGLINIATALLIIGLSLPLVKHKIKMNHLYGILIRKSFESEENWNKINEYGGKQLIIWSVPLIVVGFYLFFLF